MDPLYENPTVRAIREIVKQFKTYKLPIPRRIVLSWETFEILKHDLGEGHAYAIKSNDPEPFDARYESIQVFGAIVSRTRCTCGAL